MKTTLNSINLLIKIIWRITTINQKIKILLIGLFSITSSLFQYIQIILTAFTFSYVSSLTYSKSEYKEFDLFFGNNFVLTNDSFLSVIFLWITISLLTYISIILSSTFIYKAAYSLGKILSKKNLKIALNSNANFFEQLSEKTFFNLLTSENTMLIKGPIVSLISLPMQFTVIVAIISIVIKYGSIYFLILPFIAIAYFYLTNLILKTVRNNSETVFNLRSFQTDLLSRVVDNFLDVAFPPSGKAYSNIFNKITSKLRAIESYNATVPRILKSLLELIFILIIGFYVIYNIYFLKLSPEYFISSSAAIIISFFKLTPVISGISSTLVSFDDQYESIRNYYNLLFKTKKFNFKSKVFNYSKVVLDDNYKLNIKDLSSERIAKYSKKRTLSKTIEKQKLLWITGQSGCGKSTLLSMIAGIRPISNGSIKLSLNRKEVMNLPNLIQENIAYMPQNPIFHSITILDYIKDGDQKIKETKIKYIISKLKITKSFGLKSEELLKLVVGPTGYSPSGGQAKLLAFARALCKRNVYLYLFDEPTSDLNTELKVLLLGNIYEISKEKFVLCITHDLNSIRPIDNQLKL